MYIISVKITNSEVTAFIKRLQKTQDTNFEMSEEVKKMLLFAEIEGILDSYGIKEARVEVTGE